MPRGRTEGPFHPAHATGYGPRVVDLATYLYRALCLLGLAAAPRLLSPDPATPKNVAIALFLPLIAFGVALYGAYALRKHNDALEARVAASMVWVSVAAGIAGAVYFSGPRAPLARGAAIVGLVVWPTIAAIAATLAGAYLGSSFKHKRTAATALVLAGGLFVHGDGAKNMGDAAFMWKTALDRDASNEAAFVQVTRALVGQGKLDEAGKRAAACLRLEPTACACLVTKATIAQKKGEIDKARTFAGDAAKACPNVTAARAVNAEALAAAGKLDDAIAEADEALTMTDDPARAHAAKAMVLLSQGKTEEAREEAAKAQESGGGREAKLLLVQMAIDANDLDRAEALAKALQSEGPQDPDAVYFVALVADRRNKYNDARNGYLAALKIDPAYRSARYSLALLTYRRGVLEEAKNHAKKFADMAPTDPRTGPLMQMIFSAGAPPAASPAEPAPSAP